MTVADDATLLSHPPDLRLDGRVAWVTGASRGLGRAVAFALAGAGADLVLTARSAAPLEEAASLIAEAGRTVEIVAGSIADPRTVQEAARRIERRWSRLDVLVNNAGISPLFTRAERVEDDQWREVMDVNLLAPFACCRAALPLLEAAGGGSIVNVSSIHGTRAHERIIAYAASKGGLEMMTRTLAVEWADRGVRVNAVAPGYVETDMSAGLLAHDHWGQELRRRIPMHRFAHPAEVVPAILFLAGPGSSYITGTTLFVDGGWSAA